MKYTKILEQLENLAPPQTPRLPGGKSAPTARGTLGALAASFLLLGSQAGALAQSDNFDSGSLSSAWTVYDANPGLVSLTFPTVGTGKGLRLQANPVPNTVPAVVGIFQSNAYTDFYVAVDLVNWVVEDQAIVVFGRFTPGGSFGLDGGSGMILNYDAAQAGDSPGDRHGGELQINNVAPGFSATTIAKCEMTFEPGHSYRLVFQGVGTLFTGKAYDLQDLTTPLAVIQNTDSTYASGTSGFLSYSRNGTAGTTDLTIDNYYAAAGDPNTAILPAIAPSIPGTPAVVTRVPAKRWQNFQPPGSGISFTAQTFTASLINAGATKLYLNGSDVSAALAPFPANGSTVSFGTAPGTLESNAVYSGQIVLQTTDVPPLTSTNTFWFDTFSDSCV